MRRAELPRGLQTCEEITRDLHAFPSNITRDEPPITRDYPPSLLILQGRSLTNHENVRPFREAVEDGVRGHDGGDILHVRLRSAGKREGGVNRPGWRGGLQQAAIGPARPVCLRGSVSPCVQCTAPYFACTLVTQSRVLKPNLLVSCMSAAVPLEVDNPRQSRGRGPPHNPRFPDRATCADG